MAIDPNDPQFAATTHLGSVYSNRAYVTVSSGMARIVFGEAPADVAPAVYSSAITMTAADALNLARIITQVVNAAYPPQNMGLADLLSNYPPAPPPPQTGALGLDPFRGLKK
jgi:hypothetical protein